MLLGQCPILGMPPNQDQEYLATRASQPNAGNREWICGLDYKSAEVKAQLLSSWPQDPKEFLQCFLQFPGKSHLENLLSPQLFSCALESDREGWGVTRIPEICTRNKSLMSTGDSWETASLIAEGVRRLLLGLQPPNLVTC